MGPRDALRVEMLRGQRGKNSKEQGERSELEQGETPARKSKPTLNRANFEILWWLSFPWWCSDPFGSSQQ